MVAMYLLYLGIRFTIEPIHLCYPCLGFPIRITRNCSCIVRNSAELCGITRKPIYLCILWYPYTFVSYGIHIPLYPMLSIYLCILWYPYTFVSYGIHISLYPMVSIYLCILWYPYTFVSYGIHITMSPITLNYTLSVCTSVICSTLTEEKVGFSGECYKHLGCLFEKNYILVACAGFSAIKYDLGHF